MSLRVCDTVDLDEIRWWIRLHHGAPARVPDPGSVCSAEVLLVDFLEVRSGRCVVHISWEEWFAWFDDHRLCFRCADDPEGLSFRVFPRGATSPTVHAVTWTSDRHPRSHPRPKDIAGGMRFEKSSSMQAGRSPAVPA